MNRTQILFLSGVVLFVSLINAWVLNTGFNMLKTKSFYSSSSPSPSPSVAALSGNRFVIVESSRAQIFRIDSAGKVTPESLANGYPFESFDPLPTPTPTSAY